MNFLYDSLEHAFAVAQRAVERGHVPVTIWERERGRFYSISDARPQPDDWTKPDYVATINRRLTLTRTK
jgi:hypothetical protein